MLGITHILLYNGTTLHTRNDSEKRIKQEWDCLLCGLLGSSWHCQQCFYPSPTGARRTCLLVQSDGRSLTTCWMRRQRVAKTGSITTSKRIFTVCICLTPVGWTIYSRHALGPISSLVVFGTTFILLHDLELAEDLLNKRAAIGSDRPRPFFLTQMYEYRFAYAAGNHSCFTGAAGTITSHSARIITDYVECESISIQSSVHRNHFLS